MSEIINGVLDQYGAGLFERQQFGTAGVEGVNKALAVKGPAFRQRWSCGSLIGLTLSSPERR